MTCARILCGRYIRVLGPVVAAARFALHHQRVFSRDYFNLHAFCSRADCSGGDYRCVRRVYLRAGTAGVMHVMN